MNKLVCLAAGTLMALSVSHGASAQSTATPNNEGPLDNNRYIISEGELGEAGQRVTILLDTRYGRTWIMQMGDEGPNWIRVPLVTMDQAPNGMSLRPLPVKPTVKR